VKTSDEKYLYLKTTDISNQRSQKLSDISFKSKKIKYLVHIESAIVNFEILITDS